MSTSTQPFTGTPVPLTITAPSPAPGPQAQPALADLIPPDKEKLLFNAFFDASEPLVEIARHFNISVSTLAKWAAQPRIRAELLDIADLGRMRTHMLAAERGSRAVHTLDCISMFHQNDLEDSEQTAAIARRRDVSRKSAMDTIRIGLKDLREQFSLEPPDPKSPRAPRTPRSPTAKAVAATLPPEHRHLLNLPLRPTNAVEQLLSIVGSAIGSFISASAAGSEDSTSAADSAESASAPADTTNRPSASETEPTVPRSAGIRSRHSPAHPDHTTTQHTPETNQARRVVPEHQNSADCSVAPASEAPAFHPP